ncbi:MAG TPA: STAS domain-containing protein [Actinocrinis sp.]|nr:STAS domain-containing protein [Actinocrinis sp.]
MKTFPIKVLAGPIRTEEPAPSPRVSTNRLTLHLVTEDGLPVARIVGDLDGLNAAELTRLADDLAAQGAARLVLDLRQLYSVDAPGLAALLDAAALLAQCGCRTALAAVRPRVRHFLARMGVAAQFPTFSTVEEALRGEISGAQTSQVRVRRAPQVLSA